MDITNRHDTFFRKILSDKNIAIEYLSNSLPDAISNRLDFTTLEHTGASYVSKQLKQSFADIVFSCKTKDPFQNGAQSIVKISILIEHKSYIDRFVPFQIGSYLFSGYLTQIARKENLSIIIPILFYHGNETWEYKSLPELFDFEASDNFLKEFLPDFKCLFHSLWRMSDEQIESLSNQFLAASLLTLKHYMEDLWLEDHALKILARLEGDVDEDLGDALIRYFFSNTNSENSKFVEIIESLPLVLKDRVMSTLDFFIEKGKREGITLGAEKEKLNFTQTLLSEGKFAISEIARLVGVSVEFVENVKRDFFRE